MPQWQRLVAPALHAVVACRRCPFSFPSHSHRGSIQSGMRRPFPAACNRACNRRAPAWSPSCRRTPPRGGGGAKLGAVLGLLQHQRVRAATVRVPPRWCQAGHDGTSVAAGLPPSISPVALGKEGVASGRPVVAAARCRLQLWPRRDVSCCRRGQWLLRTTAPRRITTQRFHDHAKHGGRHVRDTLPLCAAPTSDWAPQSGNRLQSCTTVGRTRYVLSNGLHLTATAATAVYLPRGRTKDVSFSRTAHPANPLPPVRRFIAEGCRTATKGSGATPPSGAAGSPCKGGTRRGAPLHRLLPAGAPV